MTALQNSVQNRYPILRQYRLAVARRTREIVKKLQAKDFKQRVDPAQIEKVLRDGAVTLEAMEITDYWSKKDHRRIAPHAIHSALHPPLE